MKLHKSQLLPLIPHYSLETPLNWDVIFEQKAPVDVEIGFGQGEFLLQQAKDNPTRNFCGIEILWERVAKTLNHITPKDKRKPCLSNVRILRCDAWIALDRLINIKSVDNFYSLFPCPWPKKKHLKYRLFSNDFLKLINSRLNDNGRFMMVTDAAYFYDWVLEQSPNTGFSVQKKVIDPQFATKFEKKWLNEGQNKFFQVEFIKNKHVDVPVKENVEVKSFKLDSFDPDGFCFEDYKDDITVICKEIIFDPGRQKANVHLIVSEEHLTQNIRVAIYKKGDYWRLCLAEGQEYFPTEGVNRAIELVYHAAS